MYIDNQTSLNEFLNKINNEAYLCIDTEFKRDNSYFPKLCLVQIATSKHIGCVDVLKIQDLDALFIKLYEKNITWIVHSARQDLEALYFLSGKLPSNLFDTQLAASMLNLGAQISYKELVKVLVDKELSKEHTRINWSLRPLEAQAIQYALDDVIYLPKCYEILSDELTKANKLSWLFEDVQYLLAPELYEITAQTAVQFTKGVKALNDAQKKQAILLSAWREERAIDKNKPRKWIMPDKNIIKFALGQLKLKTSILEQMQQIKPKIKMDSILKSLALQKPLDAAQKLEKKRLQKIVDNKAAQYNIAKEILASSRVITKYLSGDKDTSIEKGWRYKLLKKEISNVKSSSKRR